MTIRKLILALVISVSVLTGCKDSSKAPENTTTENTTADASKITGKIETATFEIEGMTCAHGCAKSLETNLSKLDGVIKANVDYEKKTATVQFDAAKQSAEQLVQSVEDAGNGKTYKVSNMKSSGDQAMVIDPEIKKKSAKERKAAKAAKKAACAADAKEVGVKPAGCAAKKSCHGEDKSGTL